MVKNNNNENYYVVILYIYNELWDIIYFLKILNFEWNLYLIFDNYEFGFVCFFFGISIWNDYYYLICCKNLNWIYIKKWYRVI